MKGAVRAGLAGAATWEQRPEGSEEAAQRAKRSGLQPKTASAQALPCGLAGEFCNSRQTGVAASHRSGGRTQGQRGDGVRWDRTLWV